MPRLSKIGAACLAAFGFGSGGVAQVTATYLVVAGGGGGGAGGNSMSQGGGGGGGLLTGTASLNPTLSYTVIVGAGGAAGTYGTGGNTSQGSAGFPGADSAISSLSITATGGGFGGGYRSGVVIAGGNGGSGGGAGGGNVVNGGTAVSGQGYAGGNNTGGGRTGGGGGGAGGAGAVVSFTSATDPCNGVNGGVGLASSITGTSVYYAGGGASGGYDSPSSTGGTGGNGGGGNGGGYNGSSVTAGSAGGANLGGGGGAGGGVGGGSATGAPGGNGGSGVVIIRYAGVQQFGGGIVTYDGTNTIHTFKTSGQLVPLNSLTASYLIVAGGGGGGGGGNGGGGGGGAGGLLSGSGMVIDTNSTYLVTVGAGGTGGSSSSSYLGTQGGSSSFSVVSTTAVGGGYGACTNTSGTGVAGGNGGSGGGAGHWDFNGTRAGGTATAGQGNAGGSITATGGGGYGGGGGGAGAAGTNSTNAAQPAVGGIGVASSISGTSTYYAGGGGNGYQGGGAAGGSGGGGTGTYNSNAGAGTANTGGGGGGNTSTGGHTGGNGGSGVVIIRYVGSTQLMAGGTVTIAGGYVIHTFTSSGYLTPLTFIGNSLRFRRSNSSYLNRTPTVVSNRKTYTWSGWVKRGQLGINCGLFEAENGGKTTYIGFGSNDQLLVQFYDSTYNTVWNTTAVYRDPAAWYHIVWVVDTTQASPANMVKIWVNGVQVSLSVTHYSTTMVQNYDTWINSINGHRFGSYAGLQNYFDGYLTEVRFIDGQALTPNSFGAFNSYGVWQPINYGGSYGTNGFYLPFTPTTSAVYAGNFNGTSQYINAASNAAFAVGSNSFTAECWFNCIAVSNSAATSGVISASYNTNFHISVTSTGLIYFWIAGSYIVTSTNAFQFNRWNHLACVRNGTTATIYVNGVAAVSGTLSGSGSAAAMYVGVSSHSTTTEYFQGSISNARFVNGTAVYTNNFIPPTTSLTAVTNTQLLTLQNATIIDNSSNSFSLTNTGTVATTQQYALTTNISTDFSGVGNHWTPNNISLARNSTYDLMTDVPTLTSATAANYCTGNPLNSDTDGPLGDGNLFWRVDNTRCIVGTIGMSSGKFYWEHTIGATSAVMDIGILAASRPVRNVYVQPSTYSDGYCYLSNGNKKNNNTSSAYGATYTAGDVIGVAFDATAGTLTFYKNGTSQGQAYSGISGTFVPVSYGSAVTGQTSSYANFGQQPFVYTPPTGFVALNTYNL